MDVRVLLTLSASARLKAPAAWMLLLSRSMDVRVVLTLSASARLKAPAAWMLLRRKVNSCKGSVDFKCVG